MALTSQQAPCAVLAVHMPDIACALTTASDTRRAVRGCRVPSITNTE